MDVEKKFEAQHPNKGKDSLCNSLHRAIWTPGENLGSGGARNKAE